MISVFIVSYCLFNSCCWCSTEEIEIYTTFIYIINKFQGKKKNLRFVYRAWRLIISFRFCGYCTPAFDFAFWDKKNLRRKKFASLHRVHIRCRVSSHAFVASSIDEKNNKSMPMFRWRSLSLWQVVGTLTFFLVLKDTENPNVSTGNKTSARLFLVTQETVEGQ